MTDQPAQQPDNTPEDEGSQEGCGDNHSWEYLYSVFKCVNCQTQVVDD
jgi:hypothetical protein